MLPTFLELGGGKLPKDLIIDGESIAPLLLGKEKDSSRDWIMALNYGPAKFDKEGIRPGQVFGPRVFRDKQYKVWVSSKRQIERLHDLLEDPEEKQNLLASKKREHKRALAKFRKIVASLPKKDGRPLYEPRAPNLWDRK